MIFTITAGGALGGLGRWLYRTSTAAVIIVAASVCTSNVNAAVVSTLGNVTEIAAPPSVMLGALEHDTTARLFLEREAFSVLSNLAVDVTQPGAVEAAAQLTPGVITAGSTVTSYLLHADPLGPGRPIREYVGSITFDAPILGAIVDAVRLNLSDPIVGSPTTLYIPRSPDSGFEGPGYRNQSLPVRDALTISPDMRTLSFQLRSESRLDQIRIITAVVPEPASPILLACVSVMCASVRTRRVRDC